MIIEHSTTEAWLLAPVRCTSLVCLCGWVRCSMWLLLPAWAQDYLGDNTRESCDSTRVAEWFHFDRLLRTEVNAAQEWGVWLYEFMDVNNPHPGCCSYELCYILSEWIISLNVTHLRHHGYTSLILFLPLKSMVYVSMSLWCESY